MTESARKTPITHLVGLSVNNLTWKLTFSRPVGWGGGLGGSDNPPPTTSRRGSAIKILIKFSYIQLNDKIQDACSCPGTLPRETYPGIACLLWLALQKKIIKVCMLFDLVDVLKVGQVYDEFSKTQAVKLLLCSSTNTVFVCIYVGPGPKETPRTCLISHHDLIQVVKECSCKVYIHS